MPKNSSQYRKSYVKQTQTSFFDDTNREVSNRLDLADGRETQIRRDTDSVRDLSITLYDIDFSIKAFIENTIAPRVNEGNQWIDVPVVYANGEKWKTIQKDGYLRDGKGKVLTPLIVFRRTSVAVDDSLRKNRVLPVDSYSYMMERRSSQFSKYDKFSILNSEYRPREYYMVVVPEYILLDYEFIIWCQYQSQLNDLIEYFTYWQGKAFGEENYYKFTSKIDSYAIETVNNTGEDRLIRATFTLQTKGFLIPKETTRENLGKRVVSVRKLIFGTETVIGFSDNSKRYGERGDIIRETGGRIVSRPPLNIYDTD